MNAQIYEEASNWFVELRAGDVDPAGRRRFDAWIRKSPEHLRAYLEITEIWQDAPFVAKEGEMNFHALLEQARKEGNVVALDNSQSLPVKPRGRVSSRTRSRFAWAASILIIFGIAGWLYNQQGTYTTAIGEQRVLTLEDGSTVQLNARSRIKVRFTAHRRNISLLEGQALFSVARDALRPFFVASDSTEIRAVGTQFDVYRKESGTTVTVVEGRVAVISSRTQTPAARSDSHFNSSEALSTSPLQHRQISGSGADSASSGNLEILLSAGEQVTVTPQASARPRKANLTTVTAWTQRRLIFDATPLPEVVQEFNRYNIRPLMIEDSQLNGFNVSGVYASTDPALLLRFLREQSTIVVTETDREIRISRK